MLNTADVAYYVMLAWTAGITALSIAAAIVARLGRWPRARSTARAAVIASVAWPALAVWFGVAWYRANAGEVSKAHALAYAIATAMNMSVVGLPAWAIAVGVWVAARRKLRA